MIYLLIELCNHICFGISFHFVNQILISIYYSAEELMKMRASKAHPKPLPSMPPKEFVPSHSKEETEAIHSMVDENLTFLGEQRAEKK